MVKKNYMKLMLHKMRIFVSFTLSPKKHRDVPIDFAIAIKNEHMALKRKGEREKESYFLKQYFEEISRHSDASS